MPEQESKDPLPPYQRIEASLRSRVREGQWIRGQYLPGRRKLAEEYGVALSTIQRAIARLIEDGTLETDGRQGTFVGSDKRAETAVDSVAHLPTRVSSPVASRETTHFQSIRIGILIDRYCPDESGDDPENSFFGALYEGIRSGLACDNVYVSYVYQGGRNLGELCRASECDGLIIVAPAVYELSELRNLHAANIPFVGLLVSSDADAGDADLPCVDADNRDGVARAVRHLIELGHRRLGIVNLAITSANLNDRLIGSFDAMAAAGVVIDPSHMLVSAYT